MCFDGDFLPAQEFPVVLTNGSSEHSRQITALLRTAHGAGVVRDPRVLAQAARRLEPVAALAAAERLRGRAGRVERLRVQHEQREPRERLATVCASGRK